MVWSPARLVSSISIDRLVLKEYQATFANIQEMLVQGQAHANAGNRDLLRQLHEDMRRMNAAAQRVFEFAGEHRPRAGVPGPQHRIRTIRGEHSEGRDDVVRQSAAYRIGGLGALSRAHSTMQVVVLSAVGGLIAVVLFMGLKFVRIVTTRLDQLVGMAASWPKARIISKLLAAIAGTR